MVQTSTGAKSNPWITYMKECRVNYNASKVASVPESVEPSIPKVNENTTGGSNKKGPQDGKEKSEVMCLLDSRTIERTITTKAALHYNNNAAKELFYHEWPLPSCSNLLRESILSTPN